MDHSQTKWIANLLWGIADGVLIREYRTLLVADVVTGKVDVRASATAIIADPHHRSPSHAAARAEVPSDEAPNDDDIDGYDCELAEDANAEGEA